MHVETQARKGRKYYYLSRTLRNGNAWKKIRVYLGRDLSKLEIENLSLQKKSELEAKAAAISRKIDPLLGVISDTDAAELDNIRKKIGERTKRTGKAQHQNYYEHFVTQFTYDTNAIEGSTLSLQDTSLILFEKTVPKGKSLKEISEAQNHKDAFDFMLQYKGDLTSAFILKIHKILMHNILWKYAGKFRDTQVYIRGSSLRPPSPGRVEQEFRQMMIWYRRNKKKYHPAVVAAAMHHGFESVHPFMDGNGRVGRLILNFVLRKNGFPLIDIKFSDREAYYEALDRADNGDLKPLADLIIKYVRQSEIIL